MSKPLLSVVVVSMVAGFTVSLWPCCMVPDSYRGTISQSAQEAFLIHEVNDQGVGREELILRINYKIDATQAGGSLPSSFAWVITVPNEPDAYHVADSQFFEEAYNYAQKLLKIPVPAARSARDVPEAAASGTLGVELGRRAVVGPYDIQPVRARGRDALAGLNRWLADNGFPTEAPSHMKYFVDNRFTFLCVKISASKDRKQVDGSGELPPLHLSFQSEKPYYPLKFSSRQGVFDLNLYTLTSTPFDYKASDASLARIPWEQSGYKRNLQVNQKWFPKTLKAVFEKSKIDRSRTYWRLNLIRARRVNRGASIASWKSDLFLSTEPKVAAVFERRG